MNVSHHSDPARGHDGAVSWVHGFHSSGCVVPSWPSPNFFSKAFLMLRDPLKQSLGDGKNDGQLWTCPEIANRGKVRKETLESTMM